MADHGARVYGSEQIPIQSYEIPVLFYNPVLNPKGEACDVLGSQMDVAPTILDFLGIDYDSEFFGRSWKFDLRIIAKSEEMAIIL